MIQATQEFITRAIRQRNCFGFTIYYIGCPVGIATGNTGRNKIVANTVLNESPFGDAVQFIIQVKVLSMLLLSSCGYPPGDHNIKGSRYWYPQRDFCAMRPSGSVTGNAKKVSAICARSSLLHCRTRKNLIRTAILMADNVSVNGHPGVH